MFSPAHSSCYISTTHSLDSSDLVCKISSFYQRSGREGIIIIFIEKSQKTGGGGGVCMQGQPS